MRRRPNKNPQADDIVAFIQKRLDACRSSWDQAAKAMRCDNNPYTVGQRTYWKNAHSALKWVLAGIGQRWPEYGSRATVLSDPDD